MKRTVILACVVGGFAIGCSRDSRLADHDVRVVNPAPVTAYGKTLDKDAEPSEVVYVFLRAVGDDYAAGHDSEMREAAFDKQLATCAPGAIAAYWERGKISLSEQKRDELIYKTVRLWAPTFGFYVDSLRAEYDALVPRMRTMRRPVGSGKAETCDVYVNLDHPDPDQPNAGALAHFKLIREDGYWRIKWAGYDYAARSWQERFAARAAR